MSFIFTRCRTWGQPRRSTSVAAVTALVALTASCNSASKDEQDDQGAPPNVMVIIVDDFGVADSGCYGSGGNVATTPTIQALCDRGVVFANAWSAPTCSPTRAAMLTGKYPYRTGVGNALGPNNAGLAATELIIPEALELRPELGYEHAAIGKWHVGAGVSHPNTSGFDHYSGLLTGQLGDYFSWDKTTNGKTTRVERYATSEQIDDAIGWLAERKGPWFLWLALTAPHSPFHLPPSALHSNRDLTGAAADIAARPVPYFQAMTEALDTELARLFASVPADSLANTYVIFVGDNGTAAQLAADPNRAKGTLYQGGIHVPLVIAGPGIAGNRRIESIVHVADVFPTVLELTGVESKLPGNLAPDGVSLVPIATSASAAAPHEWIISELFGGAATPARTGRTIRDDRFKLIRFDNGFELLFDLTADPSELQNLLAAPLDAVAMERLSVLSNALLANQ